MHWLLIGIGFILGLMSESLMGGFVGALLGFAISVLFIKKAPDLKDTQAQAAWRLSINDRLTALEKQVNVLLNQSATSSTPLQTELKQTRSEAVITTTANNTSTLHNNTAQQADVLHSMQHQIEDIKSVISVPVVVPATTPTVAKSNQKTLPVEIQTSVAAPTQSAAIPTNSTTTVAQAPITKATIPAPPVAPIVNAPPKPALSPKPPKPVVPPTPNWFDVAFAAAKNWLLGGNTVLRVGVLTLFIGLAFLLRYASDQIVVPIELRYAGVAAAAIALLVLGWTLRFKKSNYAKILQGTGIAVLYLVVFAAMRLHPLLTATMAFALLVVVAICSAILAILQDAKGLAVAATLGGFAAPILTSTGAGSHIALFSYFVLLNLGVFAIAWFKSWRILNFVGFFGTFGIGFAWGLKSYTNALFATTEPFLILFFVMYLVIGLLFARRQLIIAQGDNLPLSELQLWRLGAKKTDYLDGTIIFGTPLIGFGLQYTIINEYQFGAAFSALGLGLLYLALAKTVHSVIGKSMVLLTETYLALGVIFATLSIPLAFDVRLTSAIWAIEAAGLYWIGLRQQRPVARFFAVLVQFGATLGYVSQLNFVEGGADTLLKGPWLGALLLGTSQLVMGILVHLAESKNKRALEQSSDLITLSNWDGNFKNLLFASGLAFIYLIAPLCFLKNGTAIFWTIAGCLTLALGLRLTQRLVMWFGLAIQFLSGVLFITGLQAGADGSHAILANGWQSLSISMLIGSTLIGGMVLMARSEWVRQDAALSTGLNSALCIGLVFINLSALFVLPWSLACSVWAATGLLVCFLGLQLRQKTAIVMGFLTQLVGGVVYLGAGYVESFSAQGSSPLAHSGFWTPVALAIAALIGAWLLLRTSKKFNEVATQLFGSVSTVVTCWGLFWWCFAAVTEINRFAAPDVKFALLIATLSASVVIFSYLAKKLAWSDMGIAGLLLTPVANVLLLINCLMSLFVKDTFYNPLSHWDGAAWLAVIVVHFGMLYAYKTNPLSASNRSVNPDKSIDKNIFINVVETAHIFGCWLLIMLLVLSLHHQFMFLSEHINAWRWLGWSIVPSSYLLLVSSRFSFGRLEKYRHQYQTIVATPVVIALVLWWLLAVVLSNGDAAPLPYLPIANPLEIALIVAAFAFYRWMYKQFSLALKAQRELLSATLFATIFVFITTAVSRVAHQYLGVSFDTSSLFASQFVQASWSLMWTLLALIVMILGHRQQRRAYWITGASLITVVVIKLFFIELQNRNGLWRIVSFIGVGILLLIVGYFAPLPPRVKKVLNDDKATTDADLAHSPTTSQQVE